MEKITFNFGSSGIKIDPKLDSLFKNSIKSENENEKSLKSKDEESKEIIGDNTKKTKINKKKQKKTQLKNTEKIKESKETEEIKKPIEKKTPIKKNKSKTNLNKKETIIKEVKTESKKRKRDSEESKETEETEDKNKEDNGKENVEENFRKELVHESLKGKTKKENKKQKKNKNKNEEEDEEPKKKKKKIEEDPEKLERTIFIGNLDKSTAEKKSNLKKLKNLFKKYGKIESIRFRSVAFSKNLPKKIAFITKEFHPERDCFNAYIVFENAESAKKATELNGTLFNDKHIRVDIENKEKKVKFDEKKSVFVGNLTFDIQEETLWKLFSECGDVVNVRIIRDSKTNLGKGFGYVTFKERSSAALALEMKDTLVNKRKIRVFRCKNMENLENKSLNEGTHAVKTKRIEKKIKGPRVKKRWTSAQKKKNALRKQKKLNHKISKSNK